MLPPFIIDQIRRREEEERRVEEQPRLDLPLDAYPTYPELPAEEEEKPARGVVILDLG